MKLYCPISGVPFRTYDSIKLAVACEHPIFSLPFEQLTILHIDLQEQEDQLLSELVEDYGKGGMQRAVATAQADFTSKAIEAIAEKNWRNPVFKLYQSKSLLMLAFMKLGNLLEVENGYAARPSPKIIDAYCWSATELFMWVCTLRNPSLVESLPRYRVSKQNENLANFSEYLDILYEHKFSIGNRYRSISEENKLRAMEMAIALLNKRRTAQKIELTKGTNHIAAKWALTITNCPGNIFDFWYGILSSSSYRITFDGVKVGNEWQSVTVADLRELRDWLEDNLLKPRGDQGRNHLDDSEYYFTARSVVLEITRRHIAIVEQGTTAYTIVNAAVGEDILTADDDKLEKIALSYGLSPKPSFTNFSKRIDLVRAMAAWRHVTKQALILKREAETGEIIAKKEETKKGRTSFEIL